MKFLPLLLANLGRKKSGRSLTLGSFIVAFFLFGLLGAIRYGFRQGIDIAGADRLVVIGRTSIIQPLPLPYLPRLKRVPGVVDVAHSTWFGGVYQDPKNFFPQFVIVPDDWRRMYPEFVVDRAEWQAFLDDRQGCVIGTKLAARFGWKVGDRIPLKAPGYLGGGGWEFNVRGIYRGTRERDDETQFWLRHDYFYEKAPELLEGHRRLVHGARRGSRCGDGRRKGHRRGVWELGVGDAHADRVGIRGGVREADGQRRVPHPRDRRLVFFTLLLVTGNTMAIAVRERTGELAVLKAIGFTDRFVLGLVLAESLLIAAIGGAIGLWLAHGLTTQDITQRPDPALPSDARPRGRVGGRARTGLLAGLLPAVGAMRLNVANALRRV